jgi:hypothetical protein
MNFFRRISQLTPIAVVNYVGKTAKVADITYLKDPFGTNGPFLQRLESFKLHWPTEPMGVKMYSSSCATTPGLSLFALFFCFLGSHSYKPQNLSTSNSNQSLMCKIQTSHKSSTSCHSKFAISKFGK